MVKYIESEGEWMELMETSKEKLVVVDFTASCEGWSVLATCPLTCWIDAILMVSRLMRCEDWGD
ncbi:hypothetical protein HJC23_006476 [Cyclotella cryptica]|uniref:Uncharacterized protein n=1 Tax=Cyclotella cryptica TaxID=29204 RepID=A0ABD3QUN9_9STRA